MMVGDLTSPIVVSIAIKIPFASRFIGSTSKVNFASKFGSKCCRSRWSNLRGTRTSHFSWNISLRKQSSTKELVFARAASNFSIDGDSSLYTNIHRNVLGIILGGGAGTRLFPLTMKRAKPAVPIGANYRLIDIPISNCINSNINKVYVLTQYNSTSLNRHVSQTFATKVGGFKNEGFVEILAAQQSLENPNWFKGTADAVRQYLWLFEEAEDTSEDIDFLVLAGDHLYRMDYQKFIQVHRKTNADITVAALPVDEARATTFGLMKIDDMGHIYEFAEKPKGDALRAMKVDTTMLGLDAERATYKPYIASMGIYMVRKEAMVSLLQNDFPEANDFGSEVIPGATKMGLKVQAFLFDGYWEDIGTIEAFYNANMGITKKPIPDFSFFDKKSPIYTQARFLPPSKMLDADIRDSVIGEGCIIQKAKIYHCSLGLRSWVAEGAHVEDSLLMGADYYETDEQRIELLSSGGIPMGIGKNSIVKKAIVDKNARIGENVKIENVGEVQEANRLKDGFFIRSGLVIIFKDAIIPHGTTI